MLVIFEVLRAVRSTDLYKGGAGEGLTLLEGYSILLSAS